MSESLVCTEDFPMQQTAKKMIKVTWEYWVMMMKRVELEQQDAPARRKRNEEEN